MNEINFKISQTPEVIIYALPTIIDICRRKEAKANLYLGTNPHMLPPDEVQKLIPLLKAQPCLTAVEPLVSQRIDIDLDLVTLVTGFENTHIPRLFFDCFEAWYDVTQPWLQLPNEVTSGKKVIFSRERVSTNFNYDFLFNLLNVGIQSVSYLGSTVAYQHFTGGHISRVAFVKHEQPIDYLETAKLIASGVYVGARSVYFAIAESLKTPRVLELGTIDRGTIPQGGQAREAINTFALDWNVRDILSQK